jgi:hypothetical protein
MFFSEGIHEFRPHFHAVYAEAAAVFDASDQSRLAGGLPPRIEGLVKRWAEAHRGELLENWDRARADRDLRPVAPLK